MAASPAQHDLNALGTSSASLNSEAGVTGGIKQPSTWERVKEWFSGDKYKHKVDRTGILEISSEVYDNLSAAYKQIHYY
jgi:hypothetical protein